MCKTVIYNNNNNKKKLQIVTTGNASLKNRTFADTNDASFDSSYSAYLQETKQQSVKSAQQPMNLTQSLSNIVDVSVLSLAKPSMVSIIPSLSHCSTCECFVLGKISFIH